MKLTITLLMSFIALTAMSQNKQIPLEKLEGKWYINQSNFPMWLKGDKINPTFNYAVQDKKGVRGLSDEVIYEKRGKLKSIKGFDSPVGNNHFVWRGKGLLGLLKSRWHVVYFDEVENWGIIKFEKTLFTPEGYDVISRTRRLPQQINLKVEERLRESGITAPLSAIDQQ